MSRFKVEEDGVAGRKCLVVYRQIHYPFDSWRPILTIWEHDVGSGLPMVVELLSGGQSDKLESLLETMTQLEATWQQKSDAVKQFLMQIEKGENE